MQVTPLSFASRIDPQIEAYRQKKGAISEKDVRSMGYLGPLITTLALGSLFVPHFAKGLAIGVATLGLNIATSASLYFFGAYEPEKRDSKYTKLVLSRPLDTTIGAPLLEEGVFRGVLQPTLQRICQIALPVTGTLLFPGVAVSVATAAAILGTSLLFGAIHYTNPHENSHIQAITSAIGGIPFGLAAARLGLGAAVGAHMMHNSIIITAQKVRRRFAQKPSQ